MKTALQQRPLPAAGWGIVAILGFVVLLIVVLIAMILLAIVFGLLGFSDLVGIDILGGIVAILGASLVFAVVAGYVADALVGVVLASLVMRGENASRWRELAVLAVGAAVVILLSSLPIVGPWVKLVVILLGLGAVADGLDATRGTDTPRRADGSSHPPRRRHRRHPPPEPGPRRECQGARPGGDQANEGRPRRIREQTSTFATRSAAGARSPAGMDPTDDDAWTAIRRSALLRTYHALITMTMPTSKPEAWNEASAPPVTRIANGPNEATSARNTYALVRWATSRAGNVRRWSRQRRPGGRAG